MFPGTVTAAAVAVDTPPLRLEIVAGIPGGPGTTVGVAAEDPVGWCMVKMGFVHSSGSVMELRYLSAPGVVDGIVTAVPVVQPPGWISRPLETWNCASRMDCWCLQLVLVWVG
jgi:hypothetical protein